MGSLAESQMCPSVSVLTWVPGSSSASVLIWVPGSSSVSVLIWAPGSSLVEPSSLVELGVREIPEGRNENARDTKIFFFHYLKKFEKTISYLSSPPFYQSHQCAPDNHTSNDPH